MPVKVAREGTIAWKQHCQLHTALAPKMYTIVNTTCTTASNRDTGSKWISPTGDGWGAVLIRRDIERPTRLTYGEARPNIQYKGLGLGSIGFQSRSGQISTKQGCQTLPLECFSSGSSRQYIPGLASRDCGARLYNGTRYHAISRPEPSEDLDLEKENAVRGSGRFSLYSTENNLQIHTYDEGWKRPNPLAIGGQEGGRAKSQ
ncbi:hypothetical protein V8C34DRAFT_90203 [Trichoderma compactum]